MALNRSQNKSKRDRLEESRARLRSIFEAVGEAKAGRKSDAARVVGEAWDLAEDIERFARKYLGHYMVDQASGEAVEPAAFHKEIYSFLLTQLRVAMAAPREHAKSTVVSFIFPLYCICYKLRRFIVLISDTEAQAILLVNAIKVELETNDELRADFGDLVDDRKWGEKDIVTATGIRVSARGAGQSLRGLRQRMFRPDLVICDDLENEEGVDNPESREKLKRWFLGTVLNLGKSCQVVVIGTILHYDSLLQHLLNADEFKTFTKRLYIAVDDEWTPVSVLWPQKWPLAALKKKEEDIGAVMFNQEWRNRPVNSDTQSFKESDIVRHAFTRASIGGKALEKLTGIDPAISKKEKADYFASVTVGIDERGFIYVLRAEAKHLSFPEQWRFICARFDEEQPLAVAIESVAYQKALKEHVDEVSRETRRYIPVVEIHADSDKFRRITAISPLVENGTIRFCLDGTQKSLISQLLFLGKIKDDLADALTMAVNLARMRGLKPAIGSVDITQERGRDRGLMRRVENAGADREANDRQPLLPRERGRLWAN